MKQRIYDKLILNLEDIVKQYRMLLDCVRKEKELLIKSDAEQLNENNLIKEDLISKIRGLEALRLNYASDLAQAVGANVEEPRLMELAQKMGGTEGDRLRSLHSILGLLLKNLTELNKENSQYAESALKIVHSAMDNIKETLMGQKTYQKKGNYQQGYDKSGHLVSKEA